MHLLNCEGESVLLAMAPAGIFAVLLHSLIKEYLFRPQTVLIGLIAGGILMIVADRVKKKPAAEELDDISYKQAFAIGCFQVLSLWPGFSRSGSTISGGFLISPYSDRLLAAFIVGMIAVVNFINMMKKIKLSWFAYYRFALAALFSFIIL